MIPFSFHANMMRTAVASHGRTVALNWVGKKNRHSRDTHPQLSGILGHQSGSIHYHWHLFVFVVALNGSGIVARTAVHSWLGWEHCSLPEPVKLVVWCSLWVRGKVLTRRKV